MPNISIHKIAQITGGKLFLNNKSQTSVEHLLLDSRKSIIYPNTLFFAIDGKNHNGHTFVNEAVNKGVCNFILTQKPENNNVNYIIVENTIKALQEIATYVRYKFSGRIIGITGSNGKTIVKEWLSTLLSQHYKVSKSPRSFNSQVGVPLSIWGINPENDFAVIEAGISTTNEMEKLQKIVSPNIGVLTHFGSAHESGFISDCEKLIEKIKFFENSQLVVFQEENDWKSSIIRETLKDVELFTWSTTTPKSNLYIYSIEKTDNSTLLKAAYNDNDYQIEIPFTDKASIENCISCWAITTAIVGNPNYISNYMQLKSIDMRLQMVAGKNNSTIISDCYNADWDSFEVAFENFIQLPNTNKTLILSAFEDIKNFIEFQFQLVNYINKSNINNLYLIGGWDKSLFENAKTFPNTNAFIEFVNEKEFTGQAILIKGARKFGLEKVVELLAQKSHETHLTINFNNLINNLNYFREHLKEKIKLMVMVKAFAYGVGMVEVARILQHHKVDYLAVAYPDEGIELRKAGITLPIMVMNCNEQSFTNLITHNLEPQIHSLKHLNNWLSVNNSSEIPIHIKLDTGMNRLGFTEKQIPKLINKLTDSPIKVASILSHLSASDNKDFDNFSFHQIKLFKTLSTQIENSISPQNPIKHILNSSGVLRFPNHQFNMIRLGIGLYGVNPNNHLPLKLVTQLKSYVIQNKTVNAGESVGYNRAWIATQKTNIAIIGIGYADGLPRLAGNEKFKVQINGKAYPIVGNICMDMCMVNISNDIVMENDEVVIFENRIQLKNLANACNTIEYEILSGINQRVKRVYVSE